MQKFLSVYISKIPQDVEISSVFPQERNDEIQNCKSLGVQKERYWSWKILELAVKEKFNLSMEDSNIYKNESGKWESHKFYFSITHSHGFVGVAVSDVCVGVDMETWPDFERKNYNLEKMITKFLSEKELKEFPDAAEKRKFLELWTMKEATFKENPALEGFYSKNIDLDKNKLFTKYDFIDDVEYCLSVCSEIKEKLEIIVK